MNTRHNPCFSESINNNSPIREYNSIFCCPAYVDNYCYDKFVETFEIDNNISTLTGTKIVKSVSGTTTSYKEVFFRNSIQRKLSTKAFNEGINSLSETDCLSDRDEFKLFVSSLGAKYKEPSLHLSDILTMNKYSLIHVNSVYGFYILSAVFRKEHLNRVSTSALKAFVQRNS